VFSQKVALELPSGIVTGACTSSVAPFSMRILCAQRSYSRTTSGSANSDVFSHLIQLIIQDAYQKNPKPLPVIVFLHTVHEISKSGAQGACLKYRPQYIPVREHRSGHTDSFPPPSSWLDGRRNRRPKKIIASPTLLKRDFSPTSCTGSSRLKRTAGLGVARARASQCKPLAFPGART
jgi:hypothetical protein